METMENMEIKQGFFGRHKGTLIKIGLGLLAIVTTVAITKAVVDGQHNNQLALGAGEVDQNPVVDIDPVDYDVSTTTDFNEL